MMRKSDGFAGALARCGGAALIAASLLAGVPAQAAGLMGTTVSAQLLSPTDGVDVTNSLITVTGGVEVSAGDGSLIGDSGFMGTGSFNGSDLPEQVDFDEFTIALRILAGAGGDGLPLTTGFSNGAQWVFSDLDIAGFNIVGAAITANSGFINFSSSWLDFDDTTDIVSLAIDTMQFIAGSGGNSAFGELTITLSTRAISEPPGPSVPEPGSVALAGVALLSLWFTRRRRLPV